MEQNWKIAREKFWVLLDEIEIVRKGLHCNISNAWFRGQENKDWPLRTSLYRIENKRKDPDRVKQLENFEYEKEKLLVKLRKVEEEITLLRGVIKKAYRQKRALRDEPLRLSGKGVELAKLKQELSIISHKIRVTNSVRPGEPEAFVNWRRMSEASHRNSWEILAEMQHYKVGTRLLDWTENLSIAMYFALEKYCDALMLVWNDDLHKRHEDLPFIVPPNLSVPCIWILNPYELAHYSTKDKRILDPTIGEHLDYFGAFFIHKTWPYRCHVPIYPPWRNPRIKAQQGMFTVQGWDADALDEQVGKNIVRKIEIGPEAAVYAVKHLLNFQGIDKFFVYRDLDSLGTDVRDKFLHNKRR